MTKAGWVEGKVATGGEDILLVGDFEFTMSSWGSEVVCFLFRSQRLCYNEARIAHLCKAP